MRKQIRASLPRLLQTNALINEPLTRSARSGGWQTAGNGKPDFDRRRSFKDTVEVKALSLGERVG